MSMTRKEFLKKALAYTGGSALLLGTGGTAYSFFANGEYKKQFPEVPGNKVKLKSNGQSVLILGAGLGGLQAACELADRGFSVTLVEKSSVPGGKLKAWKDTHFAKKYFPGGYNREHGLHGIWGFYKNLREFLGRHNIPITRLPDNESFYYFIDSRGIQNKIQTVTWPVPFDRFEVMGQGMHIPSKGDRTVHAGGRLSALRTAMKLWSFDYTDKEQRLYLDSMSFYDWAIKAGMKEEYIDTYYEGVAEMGYFMSAKECSALAVANFMRLGALPNDSRCDFYKWPPNETFLEPMVRHIESRGGQVIYNTEVTSLEIKDGKVQAVNTNEHIPGGRIRRCRVCGNLINGNERHDHCPFCGAHHENLETLSAAEKKPGRMTADHYVVAMDVPGARKIATSPGLYGQPYFNKITELTQATILCINLLYENSDAWEKRFPKDAFWNAIDFMPTGFKYLGFTTNWSSRSIPWLRKKKVDLIEVQASKVKEFAGMSYKEIAEAVHQELKLIIPDLGEYSEFYINRWDNYSGSRVGDEARRPEIQSPVDNLMFIGDWVYIPHHAVYMERTNVAAKMLTNLLLKKIGRQEGEIEILQSGTPDLGLKLLGVIGSVEV